MVHLRDFLLWSSQNAMGKHKQQVISRFFAPKPKTSSNEPSSSSPSKSLLTSKPLTPPSKISATVSFSPAKRIKSSQFLSPQKLTKKPKLSPHTQNPLPNVSLHQKFLDKLLEPPDHLVEPSQRAQVNNPLTTSSKPPNSNLKYTPLEQQVVELKNRYPDVLLMVEVGYRYRFFGKDAEIAARVLGIYAHVDHNFLTASIPTFRLHVHVRRLVGEGYKVGVVKQTETASIKAHGSNKLGPFCRGLSALYTKATIEAAEDLGGSEEGYSSLNNYLCCVVEQNVLVENVDCGVEVRIGAVAVELSTGDVVYGEFDDNFMRSGLEALVLSLSPAELLFGEPLSKRTEKLLLTYAGPASNVRVERTSINCFEDGGALAKVMSLIDTSDRDLEHHQEHDVEVKANGTTHPAIKGIMDMPGLAVQALAITLQHIKPFGLEKILLLGASFCPFSSNMEMSLSANALQQLEVLRNNSDGSESGSLLHSMNHTLTIFGSRLLRQWVTHPLCDINMISARLDAVVELSEAMAGYTVSGYPERMGQGNAEVPTVHSDINCVLLSVLIALGRSPDVQRGITRIFHQTTTPSEFISVVQAILTAGKQLQQLGIQDKGDCRELQKCTIRSSLLRKLIKMASSFSVISIAAKLLSTLNKEAAEKGDMLNLISVSDGRFPEVAIVQRKVQVANERLDSLIASYRKQLGMQHLEFMSVCGTTHLIELSAERRVPPSWVKVNSTKKTVRYHPPEVVLALDQLSLSNEELTSVCRTAWTDFLGEFSVHYVEFQAAVQALAALDCLHSLAVLSRNKNYVRPNFVNDNEPAQIQISSGRHPVLETILQGDFVPNDTCLHADQEYCQIVTGPNMGGKSCYIRQVALIAIMAQVGSFVPALSARLHVLDSVHTRMGASDNIQQGRSTFLEELSETSQILSNCTARSLVIIDELGRGTSTHDGVAIAYATLHYLIEQKRCMVLFVTHYPEVAEIKKEFPHAVGTYHVSYLTSKKDDGSSLKSGQDAKIAGEEDVTYLYKLVPGISERSFGFKVAQIAQIPASCIHRAMAVSAKLEMAVQKRSGYERGKASLSLPSGMRLRDIVFDSSTINSGVDHYALLSMNEIDGKECPIDPYKQFFRYLWSALGCDDLPKSLELLKQAKMIAAGLTESGLAEPFLIH